MRIATGAGTIPHHNTDFVIRRRLLLSVMLLAMLALVGRAVYLQILDKEFLQDKGDMQHVGVVSVSAYRGQIKDRNGEPLAISTPVQSIWVNPRQLRDAEQDKLTPMAKILGFPEKELRSLLKKEKDANKRFVYLRRQINPDIAEKVKALEITGVYFEREFKRYYPAGAVSGHLLGFTNIDDIGQEGIEHGYEHILRGQPGKKRVIKDGKGQIIKDVENIEEAIPGRDLVLTIDERLQYLAYRELQNAMIQNKAHSASLVVLDAKNGDVLATVSQPAFNPNNRKELSSNRYRNRAMVDSFEPGSTVKPFVVAAALDGGYIKPNVMIETHGVYHLGRNVVKDVHNYGTMDLTHVLQKSSNIAVTQIAMTMPPEYFWGVYSRLGFGTSAGVGFPGEASGSLLDYQGWHEFDQAILSFGYGVSTSILQLARAYTALADDGIIHSVTLLKRDEDPDAQRIFKPETARKVREMLEHVISKEGTAYQARVEGYRVAGKTGTVKKAGAGGYSEDKYLSVFVGMAPASNPRFIIAIVVDEPTTGQYYGGLVAAPAFSKVMAGALRVYGVEPDGMDNMHLLLSKQ
ncbi:MULTISPECIES: peptidoglycan D,D-transpeptidase FtsI family protein [Methylomonas]|uniref:Peptidoglycan D,D-transpeptidase FtsI n=2 Tax=Methylomonas TaxID=416 RepID=A0A126T589_9GAMM|nr:MULTISPECIES: penicillin-binding protein 2 [Methylomonas]AMK77249.1 cell division protein [Methylomonas denitrificans]OAI03114.1 cell division protein [Methylomonas methanica]TCV76433.1 peptidoglycan synthetase FtsI [Methylomonas methanica]